MHGPDLEAFYYHQEARSMVYIYTVMYIFRLMLYNNLYDDYYLSFYLMYIHAYKYMLCGVRMWGIRTDYYKLFCRYERIHMTTIIYHLIKCVHSSSYVPYTPP